MNETLQERAQPKRPWALWIALVPAVLFSVRWLLVEYESTIRQISPGCVFHRLTGLHCPGCGATRAVFALAKGDLATAWSMNPLVLLGLGIGLFFFLLSLISKLPGVKPETLGWARISPRGAWLIGVAVVMFGILRNIPFWPFRLLAPH